MAAPLSTLLSCRASGVVTCINIATWYQGQKSQSYLRSLAQRAASEARILRGRIQAFSAFWSDPSSTRAKFSSEGLPHTMQCPFLLSLTTSQFAHNTACGNGIRFRGIKILTADDMARSLPLFPEVQFPFHWRDTMARANSNRLTGYRLFPKKNCLFPGE
jgi:hypothetical protein